MSNNPYRTWPGFGLRCANAAKFLRHIGSCPWLTPPIPLPRTFDNCLENYDGDAVVYWLIEKAVCGDLLLKKGLETTGLWKSWKAFYDKTQCTQDLFGGSSNEIA